MKPSEVKETIKEMLAYVKETGKLPAPIFLWGYPGIGKSSVVKEAAEEENCGFIDTRLLHADPTDGKGIPEILDGVAYWRKSSDIPTEVLAKSGKIPQYGIWFLDEFNLAKPAVQGAFYQALLDHQLGMDKLAPGWLLIAAGNKRQEAYNVYDLPAPALNRFGSHVMFDLDNEEWTHYAITHPDRFNPDVVAFHRSTAYKYLYVYNKEKSEDAFPTPRTWEFTSNILKIHHGTKVKHLVNGSVGEAAGGMFMAFLANKDDMPDIQAILKGENIVPERTDILYLVISGIISAFQSNRKLANRLLEYSEHLTPEFRVCVIKDMHKVDVKATTEAPYFKQWKVKNMKFFGF